LRGAGEESADSRMRQKRLQTYGQDVATPSDIVVGFRDDG